MSNYPKKGFQLDLQPAPAWIAILGLVLFIALCFLVGAGRILILAFPVGSLAVGVFLYQRYPILYVGFTWWMWFVGPFIRRLIDYQSGYITPGPWTLTPLLVTSISFATLVRYLPRYYNQDCLPFILSLGGVFYGFLIGLINNQITDATIIPLLSWATPILFGFHLFVHWRDYPSYSQNVQRVFLWGILVMGVYGIWQYLVAPEWDRFWLKSVDNPTYGHPEPLGIRVWSTMMVPQKFAAITMAGLLLLFVVQGNLRFLSAGVGYLAFLLTRARTAWLTWFMGVLIFLPSLKARLQMRIIASIMVAAIVVIPLTSIEPFSTVISSRFESISEVEGDDSYQTRLQGFNELIGPALSEFVGKGLGSKLKSSTSNLAGYDNGFLVLLFSLGWIGTLPYLGGIFLLFFKLLQSFETRFDTFASAARAIAISSFFGQIGFNPLMTGEFALVLWGFLGFGMAAHRYYWYQRITEPEKESDF